MSKFEEKKKIQNFVFDFKFEQEFSYVFNIRENCTNEVVHKPTSFSKA